LFEIGEPIIVLVENVSCENKEQLFARERHHIGINECVNRHTPGLSKLESHRKYVKTHQEKIQAYRNAKWTCECCDITICLRAKAKHVKSKTHLTKIV
jgi:hypothetical protein